MENSIVDDTEFFIRENQPSTDFIMEVDDPIVPDDLNIEETLESKIIEKILEEKSDVCFALCHNFQLWMYHEHFYLRTRLSIQIVPFNCIERKLNSFI